MATQQWVAIFVLSRTTLQQVVLYHPKNSTGDIVSDSGDRDQRPSRDAAGAQRPGETPGGRGPSNGGPAKGRPASSGRPASARDGAPRSSGDRPNRDAERAARNNERRAREGERPARDDRPAYNSERPQRDERPAYNSERPQRDDRPRRDGERPARAPGSHAPRAGSGRGNSDEKRLWTKGGAPARGNSDARDREEPEDRDPFNIRSVRPRHDDPEIPEGVKDSDLDRVARNELKTLAKDNAEGVAQHLVMAAKLIETDPELAHKHATSAARRAGRIGVVRETLAITAYAIGDYALALRELRTFRRITGKNDQLPMMVDSERGIGRPDKALELGRSVPRSSLAIPVQVELAIAMSGARLDLGQADAALVELQIPQLDPKTAFSWSPALFSAYATVLEELGREAEAEEWYDRADDAADALEAENGDDGTDTIEVVEEDFEYEFDGDENFVVIEQDDDTEDTSDTEDTVEPKGTDGLLA
jgi:tetratricopeptide (TPR) repeat protein